MVQIDKIEEMLVRFMDGQTTEAEEQQLADFFHTADSIPERWKSYQEMFLSFDMNAYAFSDQELDAMCTDVDSKEKSKTAALRSRHSSRIWKWGIAASVAILLGVGITAYHKWLPSYKLDAPRISKASNMQVKKNIAAKETAGEIIENASVVDSSKMLVALENKGSLTMRKTRKKKAACKPLEGITVSLPEYSEEKADITYSKVNAPCPEVGNVASCSSPFAIDQNTIDFDVPEYPEKLVAQN